MEEGNENDLEEERDLLRDRFRLSLISIAESEAKTCELEISQPIMACISDLTFKFAEQLAKDLQLFAQHADRKTVNMDDVILAAHRNEHVATLLRSFSNDLKEKEPQGGRKRKKASKKKQDDVVIDVMDVS
ncbi:centromere protein S [Cinnamomum micranthum f. kanehirae]|uniref:Centromere protein S n=1 Tax=Cinnamomum micranthum f. kanehirae TaxID=337451 RepID=A0A3S4N5U3_9MAGN|nr:centromere protein S [Cinnamomum micranthum f. kanehirae]